MTTSVRSAPSNLASAINAAVKLLPFRFFVSFEKSQNRRSRRVLATPFACPMVFPTNAFSHLNGSLDNGGSLTYAQPTQAQCFDKSTEWPIDAYNYSLEAGYLPKYIFKCLHWNFVQCPLYPKTINLDGERKDDKYKGKFSTSECSTETTCHTLYWLRCWNSLIPTWCCNPPYAGYEDTHLRDQTDSLHLDLVLSWWPG